MNPTGVCFGMTDTMWGFIIPGITAVVLALVGLIGKRVANKVDEIKTALTTEASEIKRTAIAASLTQAVVADKLYKVGVATNGPRLLSFMLETAQQAILIAEITKDEKWMDAAKVKMKEYQAQKEAQDKLASSAAI